ncbi:ornithine decarboxylase antizyme-domain-containing protein [Podospora aff. communis PSN243]|uniref:Ornithine decarboxylase antizyme n=1 Tax=Podospora aff. communis PSN243 TaxID=3040156 RepID=A0AAV9GQJ8_9PEZI|nr:ornithine decarboxylase antizyme-domain-containing protein [Podospora aff. communis PSN243]
MPRTPRSRASTTALPAPQGPSGIPEVPSTGLPSPPSSPPLAAITSTNQLALTPKAKKSSTRSDGTSDRNHNRRGGATLRIREECERFFCETLRTMLLGERNKVSQRSRLTSVYHNDFGSSVDRPPAATVVANGGSLPPTPPDDYPIGHPELMASNGVGHASAGSVLSWLEIWDYAGGSSFRAFVAEDATGEEKSLFVFFDAHVMGRDLKQALVALIELAEGPLRCDQMIVCIDRTIPGDESKALTKGLQWAGFSLTTLDFWTSGYDIISDRWVFMGMEL